MTGTPSPSVLPDNLFFNTSAPSLILVASTPEPGKQRAHAGEILLINASEFCVKGKPKNAMTDDHVAHIGDLFLKWQAEPAVSVIMSMVYY
jgi:type I restriction enzyme M protein